MTYLVGLVAALPYADKWVARWFTDRKEKRAKKAAAATGGAQ